MTTDMPLQLEAEFISSLDQISPATWDSLRCDGNPFTRHAFLHALEKSASVCAETGWLPQHTIIRQRGHSAPLAVMPLYLKSHSYGEYVFDHAWANALERTGVSYYPKLQCCVPFTPATGSRLLTGTGPHTPQLQTALMNAAIQRLEQIGASSFHMTFPLQEETDAAKDNGFLIRSDQQFHWLNHGYTDFAAFLDVLSSRKRKQIRKERRIVADSDITIEHVCGAEISEQHMDAFYSFYQDTSNKKWGQAYLTRSFFSLIRQTMAEDILLVLCMRNGSPVAGAINFIGPDALYGRHWGCVEDHPFLHFEACYYQAIDYAIANGLSRVEAGAQGPHKIARGYEPVETTSAHWIAHDGLRSAVSRFLTQEQRMVDNEMDYLRGHLPFKQKTGA